MELRNRRLNRKCKTILSRNATCKYKSLILIDYSTFIQLKSSIIGGKSLQKAKIELKQFLLQQNTRKY